MGKINGKEVGFLIDTGATRNFVDPSTVRRLNLPTEGVKKFKIKVTGGEKFEGINCCRHAKFSSKMLIEKLSNWLHHCVIHKLFWLHLG